jgi:CheY-like chemotaxis protein
MKVLVAEDNKIKEKQIFDFLIMDMRLDSSQIHIVDNKDDTIDALSARKFDFLILDMSLPRYKGDDTEIKHLAGKDILIYMKHRRLGLPTAILTQHDVFGHHDDQVPLKQLRQELSLRFNKFLCSVIAWESSSNEWKVQLKSIMEGVRC